MLSLIALLLVSIQSVICREVELPNNLSIEIPDGFIQSEYAGGTRWTDGKNDFYFISGIDTVNYDKQKCIDKMHEYAFNLKDFIEYEKKREGAFSIAEDYTERYMYDVKDKSKIVIRTSFANDIPYILAYTNPKGLDMNCYNQIVSSVRFNGSWWQRLKAAFLKAPLLILLMPVLLCFAGGILAMFIPKKLVALSILLLMYIIGWPVMTDWTVGIVFYIGWSLLLWIFLKLDTKDFLDLTQAIGG